MAVLTGDRRDSASEKESRVTPSTAGAVVLVTTTGPRAGGAGERLPSLAAGLSRAWLDEGLASPPPTLTCVEPQEAAAAIEARDADALVVLHLDPSGDNARTLRQLEDVLAGTGAPGVLVSPERGSSGIFIVHDPADGAERAAWTLDTLLRRQPALEQLRHEVRASNIMMGGLQSQLGRWHEEMELAARVQQEFLPSGPVLQEGLSSAVVYRPAGYVSGDIYGMWPTPCGKLWFFLADAVGHGVPAALMTLAIARSLRAAGDVPGLTPGHALARLNTDLVETHGASGRFATAVCGELDPQTGALTVAGAGHPAPILWRNGSPERIDAQGPLLGVFPGDDFGEDRLTLSPGDTLLVFSDGFEVAFPDAGATASDLKLPTPAHVDRLTRAGEPGLSLEAGFAALESDLDVQAGSLHQADDVTALALRFVAAGAAMRPDPHGASGTLSAA